MENAVSLVRRWAVDWLASADPSVCETILAPEYQIVIGGFTLGPRERYIAGTLAQIDRFPGLGLTIHELMCDGDRVAVRFTEHGAAKSLDWREAAWGGIALFRTDHDHLLECWAEEDYLSRRRQLNSGECDPIDRPAPAPWNTARHDPQPASEVIVRDWLRDGRLHGVDLDDGWLGHLVTPHLDQVEVTVNQIFSAGDRVAFHAYQSGRFIGGLDGTDSAIGASARQHLTGIVRVADGRVSGGRVIRDRLGLQRALAATDAP